MYKMGVMHTVIEKKNDPPPPPYPPPFLPQEAAQFKQFPFGYENFYYSLDFHLEDCS